MSNRADQKKEALLNSQQTALNTEAAGDRAAARAPNPLDEAQTSEALRYFKMLEDPAHDFSKLPGVAFSGMAQDGAAAAEDERTALGASRFGAAAVDPNLQAFLAATMKKRREQARGESLGRAVDAYDAKIRGVASGIAARDTSKKLGIASNTSGLAANATNTFASFQPRPSPWLGLATGALGAAGQALAAGIGPRPSTKGTISSAGPLTGGTGAGASRGLGGLFGFGTTVLDQTP
jgi:hypothetical protein